MESAIPLNHALATLQRQPDDALANIVWDAVPDAIRLGLLVFQGFRPTGLVQIVPTIEGGARKLTDEEWAASETNLGDYITARSNTKPHLMKYRSNKGARREFRILNGSAKHQNVVIASGKGTACALSS